jgi:isoleucyl-tRNA synthetase
MAVVRQLAEAGRAARKSSNIRVRQALQRALIGIPGSRELPDELIAEIADELNVREVIPLSEAGEVVDITVKPNFRTLGQRFGPRTQEVGAAIRNADQPALARQLKEDGQLTVDVDGKPVEISPDEVTITEAPRSGWVVVSQQDATVALDTTITPELRRAGVAREVIRLVQNARKEAGLDVVDRIDLSWVAKGETAEALREYERDLADAVLAVKITGYSPEEAPPIPPGATSGDADGDVGVRFWFVKAPI